MEPILTYRGRSLSTEDVQCIQALIADHPQASRRALSAALCEAWDWRQANGALRDMVCRGMMLALHRAGLIQLPPVRHRPPNPLAQRSPPPPVEIAPVPVEGSLPTLLPLTFRQVRRTPDEALCNGLIETYHYLGYTQPVGEHLKYVVFAGEQPVACFAWSSAPRHLGARDRYLGWPPAVRRQRLHYLAYNTRFLILPWVRVRNLASHLLSRMTHRLPADWHAWYGHPVYFAETFVDRTRFTGACYRAANWRYLGQTTGRGKDDQTGRPNRTIKDVLGFPLVRDYRRRLLGD